MLRVFHDARSTGRSSENHSISSELGWNGVSLSRWVCRGLTRVGDSLKKQVRPPEKAENAFHSSDPLSGALSSAAGPGCGVGTLGTASA